MSRSSSRRRPAAEHRSARALRLAAGDNIDAAARAISSLAVLLEGAADLPGAWESSPLTPDRFPLELTFSTGETALRYTVEVPASTPQERLASAECRLERLNAPAMPAEIRDRLTSAIQGEALEVDKRWVRLLSQQVQTAEVELIADLTTARVQFSDLLNMKVGDVLPVELDESVTAKVDGVPVMECSYGTFNGQYALRVNRMLNMSGSESAMESEDDN